MTASLRASFGAFASSAPLCLFAIVFAMQSPVALAAPQPAQAEHKHAAESAPAAEAAATEQDKAAEEMARTRADLLAKHQGADEARLTQLMGPPTAKDSKEAGLTLVWRGPAGGGDPLPCRISATLVQGGLANIELSGHPSWDRRTCRKFLRPLLQALPWRAVEHAPGEGEGGAAAAAVLGNGTVVQMVKDGLPTQTILGRVRSHPCKFDLSAEATDALRRAAVPEVVIQAMVERNCP